MISIDEIVALAKEVNVTDPIMWDSLQLSEDHAFRLIAAGLLEYIESIENMEDQLKIALATAVKLSVENFVLNLKLLTK